MDLFGDTPRDPPSGEDELGFEGRRALAAVTARLTGKATTLQVGRYQVLEPLGHGGFATVYAGHDPELDRGVAIKVLRGSDSPGDTAHERMVREAQALAALRHPNVVEIFDVGFHDAPSSPRSVHIVMEVLTGDTLDTWRDREAPDLPTILDAYEQAALGLAAAHAVGVVHRDFKPANAMFAASGAVKVLDFGLATVDGVASQNADPSAGSASTSGPVSLTATGVVMGTPRYMAPEQHRARPITERSDQYAWCVALWEAIVGRPPFDGTTIAALAMGKRSGAPSRPPEIPRAVYRVLARGLSVDPEARFENMEALLVALRPRRRRHWAAGIAVAAVAGVVTVAASARGTPALCANEVTPWTERFDEIVERMSPPRSSDRYGEQMRIRPRLERFETQWSDGRDELCASPIGGDEQARATMACLQRGREQFDAILESVIASDALAPKATFHRLLRLPVPQRCASGEADRLYVADPEREQQLERFAAIAEQWDDRENVIDEATLARVSAEADALGDHWISARLAVGRSLQHLARDDAAAAAEDLRVAIYTAENHRDPLLAVELLPSAIGHRMDAGAFSEELETWFQRTEALLEVAGQPAAARLRYLSVRALAEAAWEHDERAIAFAEQAIEAAGDPPIPGTERTLAMALVTIYTLQTDTLPPEEVEAGIRRGLALGNPEDRWYPNIGALGHFSLCDLALEAGDIDAALAEQLEGARLLATTTSGPNASMMYALAIYGRVLSFRGADTLGIAHLVQGYDWIADNVGPLDGKLEFIGEQLADANLERGQPTEALEWARREQEHADTLYGLDSPRASRPRVLAARALTRLGRLDEAEADLRVAAELASEDPGYRFFVRQATAELRLAQGRHADALEHIELALSEVDPDHRAIEPNSLRGELQATLAGALRGLGRSAEADVAEREAVTLLRRGGEWHRRRASALFVTLGGEG